MNDRLTLTALLRFWLPLQATWLMMAAEGPFLAAVIARLPDPKHNLAAFGVAFALGMLLEAPVIMMMSAATALADGAQNYRRLRNFMQAINAGITAVLLVLALTPAWDFLAGTLLNLDPEVARLARTALVILLPWPAAIGFRRFYQGILIRTGRTRLVAWGTVIRLAGMAATALALYHLTGLPGAWIGTAALSAGVVAEGAMSRLMALRAVRETLAQVSPEPLDYRAIHHFYLPLALTSTIALAVQPLTTFFMGLARDPLESLAVLPVVNSLVFIFRTPGLSFQEAAITMLGRSRDHAPQVRRFASLLAAGATACLAVIAWTPLLDFWLHSVSGLSSQLARYAVPPIRILVLIPPMSVLLSMQRAWLVHRRRTGPVTWASSIEIAGIGAVLLLTTAGLGWIGATAAAVSLVLGRSLGTAYLARQTSKS